MFTSIITPLFFIFSLLCILDVSYTLCAKLSPATRGLSFAHGLAPTDLKLDSMQYSHRFLNGNRNLLHQKEHFLPHKTHFNSTSSHYAPTLIETANISRNSCSFFVLCMKRPKWLCMWKCTAMQTGDMQWLWLIQTRPCSDFLLEEDYSLKMFIYCIILYISLMW